MIRPYMIVRYIDMFKKLLLLVLLINLVFPVIPANSQYPPTVISDEDGSPICYLPWQIKFTNNSVACNADGTVSIDYTGALDSIYIRQDGTTPLTANWDAGSYILTIAGLIIDTANGYDITPGSDINTDLLTINVTGTPKVYWDEGNDLFDFTKGVKAEGTATGQSIMARGFVVNNSSGVADDDDFQIKASGQVNAFGVDVSANCLYINGICYTFPSADGTSGQLLKTNASKVLTWSADNNTDTSGLCASHDGTDINCSGEVITVVDDQHNHTTTTISGLVEADIDDLSHTTDTNANTICVGTDVYLDGEGNCDTISASGEANTMSSQGTGTSIYYQKSGVDLQLNAIKSENNRLTVALDGVTHDIELTVNEANIDHDALTNFLASEHFTEASIDHTAITNIGTNAHSVIDTHLASTSNPHSITWAQVDKTVSDIADITTKSHTSLSDIGTNTHTQIDTHIGLTNEHIDWTGAAAGTIHTDNYIEGGAGTDTTAIHDNVASEISAITEKVTPVDADMIIIEDSADSNNKKMVQVGNLPGGGSGISAPVHWQAQHTEADTTNGGTNTAAAWTQLKYNTEKFDDLTVTLSSNQVTLPAGTYWFDVTHVFYKTADVQLAIYNVTDASYEHYGMVLRVITTDSTGVVAMVQGRVSLAGTKTLEIRYYTGTSQGSNGLGFAASNGVGELYGYWNITEL